MKPDGKEVHGPAAPIRIERRSVVRRKCEFDGIITDGSAEHPVSVTDISTEGVCLLADGRLVPNSVLELSFHFREGDCWDYQVRVVNVGLGGGPPWRHGCRFLQPTERAEVLALLAEGKENVWVRFTGSAEACRSLRSRHSNELPAAG
jgi:hypothetical protein